MSFKEQYWKYSLIIIIIALGIVLFIEFIPFLGGILGAFTIYILLIWCLDCCLISDRCWWGV